MISSDARDAIIAGVKRAGAVDAKDLGDMIEPLISGDKLRVIRETASLVRKPITDKELERLTYGMISSDATKAVQELLK